MITDEYLDLIERSAEQVEDLLPKGSKLLFAALFKYENMDITVENIENGEPAKIGSYVECYQIVNVCGQNTNAYEPLKKELVFEVPEFTDMNENTRTDALRKWLETSDEDNEYFCDLFIEEILDDSWRVFVPNRVPEDYGDPEDECYFIAVA